MPSRPSRRVFLKHVTGASLLPAFARKARGAGRVIGVQLYTVRDFLSDPLRTLKALDEIGYREAELVGDSMEAVWPAIQQTRLKPVSVHVNPDVLFSPPAAEKFIGTAQSRGFRYIVYPWVAEKHRGAGAFRAFASKLNDFGRQCRAAGIRLCYHNHAFEFAPAGSKTILEQLMEETDPGHVVLELDIFWVSITGNDPVQLLAKYKGRVPLMHVKDIAKGTAKRLDENVPPGAFKEVGSGSLDIPKMLEAGASAGVEHFFVEQDETTGGPISSLRASYAYLKAIAFFS